MKLSAESDILLARMTGDQTLVSETMKYVFRKTLIISSNYQATAGSYSFDEHLETLRAMERRDTAAEVAVMREHLIRCERSTPHQPSRAGLKTVLGRGGT